MNPRTEHFLTWGLTLAFVAGWLGNVLVALVLYGWHRGWIQLVTH